MVTFRSQYNSTEVNGEFNSAWARLVSTVVGSYQVNFGQFVDIQFLVACDLVLYAFDIGVILVL